MLMEEAERIAIEEHKSSKMAVIAGVGTRHYYRKLGYYLQGPYMVKDLIKSWIHLFTYKSYYLFIYQS